MRREAAWVLAGVFLVVQLLLMLDACFNVNARLVCAGLLFRG